MGADGVMIIPPFYSVPTDDELYAHYKKVSDSIGIPIMVYNNPATANVDMQPELLARLARSPTAATSRNRRSIRRACATSSGSPATR